MKLLLSLASLFVSATVFATDVHMLNVQSESEGDKVAEISLQVNANNEIINLTYLPEPTKPLQVISLDDLNADKVTLIKQGPVKVVNLYANSHSKKSFTLTIDYMYEHKLFKPERREKNLEMYYVAPTNLFETFDPDTKKVITNAYLYVHYVNGKAKGIDHIETW